MVWAALWFIPTPRRRRPKGVLYIRNHITKIAAMPIYTRIFCPPKIFPRTGNSFRIPILTEGRLTRRSLTKEPLAPQKNIIKRVVSPHALRFMAMETTIALEPR